MAKKQRKHEGRKQDARQGSDASSDALHREAADASPVEGELVPEGALVIETSVLPPGASPLAREQEQALELGLAFTGVVMGALTGLGQVPLGAEEGNVPAAMLGGVLGGLLGLVVGRSLFFEAAQQWVVWSGLAVLCLGSFSVLRHLGAPLELALAAAILAASAVAAGMFVHRARQRARQEGASAARGGA